MPRATSLLAHARERISQLGRGRQCSEGAETGTGGAPSASGGSGGAVPASGGQSTGGSEPGVEVPVTWPLVNGVQWVDTEGAPIQAHGGGMLKVGDDYYWFGENRNPDGTFFAVSAYRSKDLRRWEHAGDVLAMDSDTDLKPANVERPKVVFNEATQKYVMWMHWENGQDYGQARAAVASSDTINGNYTYHGSFRPYQDRGVEDHGRPGYMSRDCTLFVDDDGNGYFLSSSNENADLHLYLLSDDYLSVDSRVAVLFPGGKREAPALFKRGETYFLLTSGCTGWDPNQAKYATSTSLTSGWSDLKDVANGSTFYSQSTYVQPIEGTQGTEYLYMGDRWAGAWGGRVNDSTYLWQPISFPSPTSMSMDWNNTLFFDVEAGHIEAGIDDFVLVNQASGLVLAVDGDEDQDGADLLQLPASEASSLAYKFDYDTRGHFKLLNRDSNRVIDVPDESLEPGVDLHLWEDNDGAHQAWRLLEVGRGYYRLKNANSGLFLGVENLQSGARIEQQEDTGEQTQVWQLITADSIDDARLQ